MVKYLKNPFVWVVMALVCYVIAFFVPVAWIHFGAGVLGVVFCLVGGKLLDNHIKNSKDKKRKKLSMLTKSMYASVIIVMAMCVSTFSPLVAPICWCVAFAMFIWYLYERVQEYMKEVARNKYHK